MQKVILESCDSTNEIALDLAREGCEHGTAVIAKKQTRGKGRLGRSWSSFEGSLAMSVVVRPTLAFEHAYRLVALSAQATAETVDAYGVETFIKWPNDILIKPQGAPFIEKLGRYRKLGGILLEMIGSQSRLEAAIIGIGLNLKPPESDQYLIPQMGFVNIEVEDFVDPLLNRLEQDLALASEEQEYLKALSKIRSKSAFLGHRVKVDSGSRVLYGTLEDLLPDGGLLLRVGNGLEKIYVGDVSLEPH